MDCSMNDLGYPVHVCWGSLRWNKSCKWNKMWCVFSDQLGQYFWEDHKHWRSMRTLNFCMCVSICVRVCLIDWDNFFFPKLFTQLALVLTLGYFLLMKKLLTASNENTFSICDPRKSIFPPKDAKRQHWRWVISPFVPRQAAHPLPVCWYRSHYPMICSWHWQFRAEGHVYKAFDGSFFPRRGA